MEKLISSRLVYSGRAVKVRVDTVQKSDGKETTRDVVEHADAVVVVPVDANDNILLVKQYRQAVGKDLLELPAGGIEPGEDTIAAVAREMREETGFLPRKIVPLGGFYSAPGYATEYLYLFYATEMIPLPLVAEDTAEIKTIPVPKDRIPGMIAGGEIRDSKSVAGLLRYLFIDNK